MEPSILDALMAPLLAAVGAYGHAVLTKAEETAADSTVRLGQRLLAQLRRGKDTRKQLESAVADVADHPGDEDFQSALRAQIKKTLLADPDLEVRVQEMLQSCGINATAIGERTVAVRHNQGIISTGDGATNWITRL